MTYAADQPAAKPPGPRLPIAIAVIILGTVLGIGGLAVGVSRVVHEVLGPRGVTPASFTVHLDSGTWQVYVAGEGFAPPPELNPLSVTVTGPSGQSIATRATSPDHSETLSSNNTSYLAEVAFTATQSGEYHVTISRPAGVHYLLSKSIGDIARTAVKWFVLMAFGFLIGVLGVVLLIIGISRRRSARRPREPAYQTMGGLPPPGWYPDPSIAGINRWWDGTKWSDQTHPM
jgi:hypothetical protein